MIVAADQKNIKLIECPRDAMQGWPHFISTEKKIAYINKLLEVGFDTLDCGSFVSTKSIPQMADTAEVLQKINYTNTSTKLLTIVANVRGAEEAVAYNQISYLGFPFSVSPTFQLRNTNSTIPESLNRVKEIQQLCVQYQKQLVVYISMGFGNPYGDDYNASIVFEWVDKLAASGIKIFSLADTVGLATAQQVFDITHSLLQKMPGHEIGVHLHSNSSNWHEKLQAAVRAGCTRFDGALKGIGGCPMADDELVGNMDTSLMIPFFKSIDMLPPINTVALSQSLTMVDDIFR